MIQLQYTESFIAGTGCETPEEVILKGLKDIRDWCKHLEKWGRTEDAIDRTSEVMEGRKYNTRVKREILDQQILEAIKRLNKELIRGCTVLELVQVLGGGNKKRFEHRIREGIDELMSVGLICVVDANIEH